MNTENEPRRNCDAVSVRAIPYSFEAENSAEYGPNDAGGWAVVYPSADGCSVDECKRILDSLDYPDDRPETDDDEEEWREAANAAIQEGREQGTFDPMMSTAWPVPGLECDGETALAVHLDGENMTLVTIDDEPYLVLTGGGMDFSWSIARTYIALGYWPPAALDLPNQGEFNAETFAAVCESKRIAIRWLTSSLERLEARFAAEAAP